MLCSCRVLIKIIYDADDASSILGRQRNRGISFVMQVAVEVTFVVQ